MTGLLDARGVEVRPGDSVIYGFAVGRSVAMAEGVILGDAGEVSLTATGRVRVRVWRRSYGGGSQSVVSVAPDRLVVLKWAAYGVGRPYLPTSPLPTQDEEMRVVLHLRIARHEADLGLDEPPPWWTANGYGDLEKFRSFITGLLERDRRKLEGLDG